MCLHKDPLVSCMLSKEDVLSKVVVVKDQEPKTDETITDQMGHVIDLA